MINNVDSLQLSKNFGILLFPDLYGKNKYYRLTGIEKKSSYDQNALYGEKVPNAWDFYNYQVGDTICSISYRWDDYGGGYPPYSERCDKDKITIMNKQLINNSYIYNTDDKRLRIYTNCGAPPQFWGYKDTMENVTIASINNPLLYSTTWECNVMYPGMLYTDGVFATPNLIKFGTDNYGNFYKYCGPINIQYFPYTNFAGVDSYSLNNNGLYQPINGGEVSRLAYASGFGRIVSDYFVFEHVGYSYVTAYSRNGVSYFGTTCPSVPTQSTGIIPNSLNNVRPFFYPNPASSSITVPVPEKSQIEISNALGQIVFTSETEGDQKIDVSSLPNGIYFVTLKNSGYSIRQKLIISR